MAKTKEFIVALENKPGTLADVAKILADANVNILGVDLRALGEFGTARFITSDPTKTEQTLRTKGLKFTTTEVVTAKVPNKVGQLAEVTQKLAKAGINIEAAYGIAGTLPEAEIAFKVDKTAEAEKVLKL